VAQWIEDYADAASKDLAQFDRPEYRRVATDVAIQVGLGRFFGAKFRSGVLYRIYEQTGNRTALEQSLKQYRAARAAWAELANRAKVYVPDLTVGERPQLRGHWLDRLPTIDADIALLEKRLEVAKPDAPEGRVALAINDALARPRRTPVACGHTPPQRFRPGQPLQIEISFEKKPAIVRLHYRHVNHAERYQTVEMETRAVIPATYTDSQFPLQYYFEVDDRLYPGLGTDLTTQPYFVVRRS
jgi:hypothetical protein